MAAGDTQITIAGNLVDDPELRYTPTGQAVTKFRVASTPRFRDSASGEWKDGDSLFLTCNVWRQAAENVAESLQRGMRVIVTGRLRQRSYETREGEKRTVYEVEVDDVGPSMRNASAKVTKSNRSGGGGFGSGSGSGGLLDALPSGSYLSLNDGTSVVGGEQHEQATEDYNESGALPYIQRTPEEIASFFDGLELVPPGVVSCPRWRPESTADGPPAEVDAFGGVGRKP